MNRMHGIIFAYEQRGELRELTERRTAASMPFGGRYRAVDFALSNLLNAGVTDVGMVLHGRYQSMLDHVGSGKVWDMSRKRGGLHLLPPFNYLHEWGVTPFRGKMEALAGVRDYLNEIRQDYVVLMTLHSAKGLFNMHQPRGYRSLDVFVMSTDLLRSLVDECQARDQYSFRRDVLQAKQDLLHLQSYTFSGFAAQIRSVQEYYDRSMQLLDKEIREDLFTSDRPIRAKGADKASTYIGPDGVCLNSLVAEGCRIEGTVVNSILFPGVTVEKGAKVEDCILFRGTTVREAARLSHVITDKHVELLPGRTMVGHTAYPIVIAKGSVI